MRVVISLWRLRSRIHSAYWTAQSRFFYRYLLGRLGTTSKITRPLKIVHPEHIYIGDDTAIAGFCWLGAYPQEGMEPPRLVVGDNTVIGHFSHITCVNRVEIGSKVLIADRVHISDNEHVFQNADVPIVDQGVLSRGPVVIGDSSWIGENVCVLSCKIGSHCVIGANAVVISDIPDFSVAVGVPARVVKRYDRETRQWKKVKAVENAG